MRRAIVLLLCLGLGACSSLWEHAAPEVSPQPDVTNLLSGLHTGIGDSHFAAPIEVTDLLRAPAISSSSWLVCIRSAQSDETRRLIYSVFFNEKYVSSRYSVSNDGCVEQQFHPFVEPAKSPPPSDVSPPSQTPPSRKKHRRGAGG